MFYVEHFAYSTVRAWREWPDSLFEIPKAGLREGRNAGRTLPEMEKTGQESGRAGPDGPGYSLNNPGAENKSGATWKG